MKTTITAPEGVKFLSQLPEFQSGLPQGILDKGSTGCGMTSLALECDEPYIIAMPLLQAIENKVDQYDNLFVIKGGVRKEALKRYLNKGGKKILVTYDSLWKIATWCKEWNQNAYSDFKLLVDEYQDFLRFYGLKKQVYREMVKEVDMYAYKTLGSATPIPAKYAPNEFKQYAQTQVVWPHTSPIQIISKKVSCPTTLAVKLIKAYMLNGKYESEGIVSESLNVFVNSIESILTIIKSTGLEPDQCRVICGSDPANKKALEQYFGLRGKDIKDPYLITFITSAGYNSIDLYGQNTMSISLSFGQRQHTLQSTFIDLPQIAGRMRNEENPFYRILFHYYTNTPLELSGEFLENNPRPLLAPKPQGGIELTKWFMQLDKLMHWKEKAKAEMDSRFEEKLQKDIAKATKLVNDFNQSSDSLKELAQKLIDRNAEEALFWVYDEEPLTFELDSHYITYLRFQQEELKLSYIDGKSLRDAYERGNMQSKMLDYEDLVEKVVKGAKLNFTGALTSYLNEELEYEAKKELTDAFPDILTFTSQIPESRIRGLMYSRKALNEELNRISREGQNAMRYQLSQCLESNTFYSSKELKALIQEVYKKTIGFKDQKAKATDVMKYFPESKECRGTVDGKQKRGIEVQFTSYTTTLKM